MKGRGGGKGRGGARRNYNNTTNKTTKMKDKTISIHPPTRLR